MEIRLTMFSPTELASRVSLRKYKTHSDRMIYGVKGDLPLLGIRHAIIHIVITFILGTFVIVFHKFKKKNRMTHL